MFIGLFFAFGVSQMAAKTEPEVRFVDNRVSIQAEGVPLARLLHLLDKAAGITSKVPPELANLNISACFTDLDLNDAIHKIFEGQSLNYVFVEGQGVIVTGIASVINFKNLPPPTAAVAAPENVDINNAQRAGPPRQQEPQRPATANSPAPQTASPQQPTSAPTAAGQGGTQNPFTGTLPGFMSPNPLENNTPTSYPNTVPNNGGFPATTPTTMPNPINP
jgi:hypothetical protein